MQARRITERAEAEGMAKAVGSACPVHEELFRRWRACGVRRAEALVKAGDHFRRQCR